ncbi:hypothetical protein [Bacillus atrophaeus]|uniref:hypothetical protein n=1 Tax=Bacillus atrophaeus TaxID=1452 RepID=UPI002E22E962|nr:hypothetical protein [Bacillus atrophaeus]MED1117462.1 hypothetical protein [Bacillus atrophaeus]MED1131234.1 hypothetical protein [Bacillus atrophaeus]
MEGRQPVSISLAKSRAAIMAVKNALFTPWSAVTYPIMGQIQKEQMHVLPSRLQLFCL